jgi:nicotinic acid phosphoribosyltransferase
MFHGAMYGYSNANYLALTNWADVYDGDLGIALSDTYTSDVFFKNFSKRLAKLYDGVRQDSGDPFKFISKATKRYRELGVDPSTKTIVFSDALTMDKAVEIKNNCQGRIKCSFGIGTHLTNDVELKPANIVMKLTSCQINKNNPIKEFPSLADFTRLNIPNFNIAESEFITESVQNAKKFIKENAPEEILNVATAIKKATDNFIQEQAEQSEKFIENFNNNALTNAINQLDTIMGKLTSQHLETATKIVRKKFKDF